ncbi:MAG: 3-dehydroquinate synthase [Sphingobacterium sp.]|uniref:3-dehydroquinate synthase n=1 Tax=Sphingobacterium sp. JB170 TaxID=1434842 RepID=UPI00097E9B52|nr:3-dehydroquinate synthase [Sphingobacterium sp. JB170]SJN20650.1 3-dehydroquinate synthase [Sphingobacterium sp. JB170]
MERTLEQNFRIDYQYNIYFTDGLFTLGNDTFREFLSAHSTPMFKQKILFVLDDGMLNKHPKLFDQIRNYFKDIENVTLTSEPLVLPGGERCKNDPKSLEQIIGAVDQYGVDRHSYIVAIGGGALLDLTGFAAAVAHRGIKHIRIPTTVLSQNDSGVGVKNGVNYTGKKNFLGTFAPPVAVFNDAAFLQTLDDRSWLAGISEAVKVALIKDLPFFHWIQAHAEDLRTKSSQKMGELIYRCAELHLAHIRNGDPFELGSSRPLDFGHWSAHKLEQMTNFELLHGEAVSIGLAIDVLYSLYIGNIAEHEARTVIDLFMQLGLPIYHPVLDNEDTRDILLAGLLDFQEHLGGKLTVVLLSALGTGKDYHQMDHALIRQAIDFLKTYSKKEGVSHAAR